MDLLDSLEHEISDWTGWYTKEQIMERTGWTIKRVEHFARRKVDAGDWEMIRACVAGHIRNMYRLKP